MLDGQGTGVAGGAGVGGAVAASRGGGGSRGDRLGPVVAAGVGVRGAAVAAVTEIHVIKMNAGGITGSHRVRVAGALGFSVGVGNAVVDGVREIPENSVGNGGAVVLSVGQGGLGEGGHGGVHLLKASLPCFQLLGVQGLSQQDGHIFGARHGVDHLLQTLNKALSVPVAEGGIDGHADYTFSAEKVFGYVVHNLPDLAVLKRSQPAARKITHDTLFKDLTGNNGGRGGSGAEIDRDLVAFAVNDHHDRAVQALQSAVNTDELVAGDLVIIKDQMVDTEQTNGIRADIVGSKIPYVLVVQIHQIVAVDEFIRGDKTPSEGFVMVVYPRVQGIRVIDGGHINSFAHTRLTSQVFS